MHQCLYSDRWSRARSILFYLVVAFESFFSLFVLMLFIRPLCQLNKSQNDSTLQDTIVRVALLNGFMIISSLICLTMFNMVGATFVPIIFLDNFICLSCMVLMLKVHEHVYLKLCWLCMHLACYKAKLKEHLEIKRSHKNKIEVTTPSVTQLSTQTPNSVNDLAL